MVNKKVVMVNIEALGIGRHRVAPTLYVVVQPSGSRSYVQRVSMGGKQVDRGLGGCGELTLNEALGLARDNRKIIKDGGDPWAVVEAVGLNGVESANVGQSVGQTSPVVEELVRQNAEMAAQMAVLMRQLNQQATRDGDGPLAIMGGLSFEQALRRTLGGKFDAGLIGEGWRDDSYRLMERYVLPHWQGLDVGLITQRDVVRVLEKVAKQGKADLARRLRSMIRATFDDCLEREEVKLNAADDRVKVTMRRINVTHEVKPREGLHYKDVVAAYKAVGGISTDVVRHAVRMVILTACRSQEVRQMRWEDVDLVERVWSIPAESMKMKRGYRVPLSGAALMVLYGRKRIAGKALEVEEGEKLVGLVFPSSRGGGVMDSGALVRSNRRVGIESTVHGYRVTFKGWAEEMGYRYEVVETQLAHAIGNATERAYHRVDYLAERREMMEAWGKYVSG